MTGERISISAPSLSDDIVALVSHPKCRPAVCDAINKSQNHACNWQIIQSFTFSIPFEEVADGRRNHRPPSGSPVDVLRFVSNVASDVWIFPRQKEAVGVQFWRFRVIYVGPFINRGDLNVPSDQRIKPQQLLPEKCGILLSVSTKRKTGG